MTISQIMNLINDIFRIWINREILWLEFIKRVERIGIYDVVIGIELNMILNELEGELISIS